MVDAKPFCSFILQVNKDVSVYVSKLLTNPTYYNLLSRCLEIVFDLESL